MFHDSARDQLLKARAQDVLCQSQALLKIGEASYAREGVTNDQQRPPFADGVRRACHGAQVGFEGFVSHSSSQLIARKSGCTIIPDSGILSVVASCNQAGRRRIARLIRLQDLKLKRSKTMTSKLNIRRITSGLLPIIALVFGGALAATSQTSAPRKVKNIVLIHGGFVDGSGLEGVDNTLKKKAYNINVVQNPTISLADDVAVTKRAIAAQDGPVILVGHSYVGVVITEAGTDPKVGGLAYVAAFAPDRGESVETLIKNH